MSGLSVLLKPATAQPHTGSSLLRAPLACPRSVYPTDLGIPFDPVWVDTDYPQGRAEQKKKKKCRGRVDILLDYAKKQVILRSTC